MDDITRLNSMQFNPNYMSTFQQPTQEKKKVGGVRGALLNFLPTAASALGAAGGTLLAPGAGTLAGGAVGGGLGEFLRAKLSGENVSAGNIARETAFGAVPGALSVAGKGIRAIRGAKGAAQAAEATTESAMQARKGIVSNVKDAASQASSKGFGVEVGQSAGRGKVLTPDSADNLQSFITSGSQRYGGIRPGKPINQAKDAQSVYNNVTKSLDDTLTKIDRPTQAGETSSIVSNMFAKVADSGAVTKATPTAEKFASKIQNAKSIKELEKIRREADDIAFTSTGAGKTSAAAQSKAVRDAIDEFITPLSDEYKAIKGDYTLARDALDATSKASKNAKGFPVPFTNGTVTVGDQAISGAKNKIAAKVAGTTPPATGVAPTSFRPFMGQVAKAAVPQATTRAVGSTLFGTPFVGSPQQPDEQAVSETTPPMPTVSGATTETPQAGGIFSDPSKVEEAYLKAIAAGDTQGAAAIMKGYETFGKTASEKPLSAEASKVIANANSGLDSLSQLEQMIAQDPSALQKTVIPGRSLFGGAVGNAVGTAGYDTAARNVADVITRLRTGAALTDSEERFYKSQLPQAFDSPEVIQQKLKMFRDLFSSVGNRTGSAGTDLQQTAGM